MLVILWIIEIVIGVLLVVAVLLQVGRGDIGAIFGGGGAQSIFGPTGPTTLLQKATYALIALFFLNTFAITKLTGSAWKEEREVIPERRVLPEEVLPEEEQLLPEREQILPEQGFGEEVTR